jgi:hypothetical protein
MALANRCVINAMGGTTHNYSYCIRDPDIDITTGPRQLSMQNVGKVFGELSNYMDYLIRKPDGVTRNECKDALSPHKPLLGNRYVLKTSLKCIPVNPDGRTICNADNTPLERTLNKYIDNVSTGASFLTGGADVANGNGLIPSMAGSIEKLAYNIYDVAGSFTQESKPYCLKAKVKCHIVAGKDSLMNYRGPSPDDLYFSLEDITKMRADSFINDARPTVPTTIVNSCISGVGFKNIEDNTENNIENNTENNIENNTENNTKDSIENNTEYSIEDIIDYINKNIITQNGDKIIYSSNIDNIIESVNFEDSTIVKIYYLGLSLLMLLIMFKLLYGKHKI